jgi:hypothetical protein
LFCKVNHSVFQSKPMRLFSAITSEPYIPISWSSINSIVLITS